MQKLFWKTKNAKTIEASEISFKTEDEFERFIFNTKEILPDVFILKRQVRAGKDIPDLVGVDENNSAVIIENKNVEVGEEILPQIMRYAVWAETHQDTIRLWWQEAEDRPEDIEIDWEKLQIRLIVLAPAIKSTVPRLVKKLGYPVDLIEIKKFVVGKDEIILLNKIEAPAEEGRAVAKGMPVYDKEFYKDRKNPRSVDAFFKLQAEIERIVKRKGWKLEPKMNANYAAFNHGFFNAFGIGWAGTKSFEIFVKLPKNKLAKAKRLCPYPVKYDDRWKQVTVKATDDLKPERMIPVFQFAHDLLVGEHPAD
jgi:hypothetical protein